MSLPVRDGITDVIRETGAPRFFLPIPQDHSTRALEQDYIFTAGASLTTFGTSGITVSQSGILPFGGTGTLPLSSVHQTLLGFYLVEEKNWEKDRGGVYKFTRVYSQIPRTREEWQSYSWQVPGIGTTSSAFAQTTVSSMVNSGSITTITATSHGLSTDDYALVQFNVVDTNGNQYTRQRLMVVTVTGANTFTVPIIVDISAPVSGTMACRKVEPGRDAETQVVNCKVVYDYFLPGVTAGISTPQDIPNLDPLYIMDNTGRKTNTLSGNTSPTTTQYKAYITAGTMLQIERSTLTRWRGNIWERVSRFTRAI